MTTNELDRGGRPRTVHDPVRRTIRIGRKHWAQLKRLGGRTWSMRVQQLIELVAAMLRCEGDVWCHYHGCVHPDQPNYYEVEGEEDCRPENCRPENWEPVYRVGAAAPERWSKP